MPFGFKLRWALRNRVLDGERSIFLHGKGHFSLEGRCVGIRSVQHATSFPIGRPLKQSGVLLLLVSVTLHVRNVRNPPLRCGLE